MKTSRLNLLAGVFSLLLSAASLSAQNTTSAAAAPATPASTPAAPASALPTIFVCGDSTANSGGRMQGWGTPIANYFDPAKVTVANVAQAGTSSRSFYKGNWPRILPRIKAGDYALIVFGINDNLGVLTGSGGARASLNGTGDETADYNGETVQTYGWYLAKMAADAREKGATVYLLTVTTRDIWTNPKATFKDAVIVTQEEGYDPKQDKIERGTADGQYTQWTKDVGKKINAPVLDLTNLCADKYEAMGREAVMVNYVDHNHTLPSGADLVAASIISGLKAFPNSPFIALLSEKGKAVQTADKKYITENLPAPGAKPATSTVTPAKN